MGRQESSVLVHAPDVAAHEVVQRLHGRVLSPKAHVVGERLQDPGDHDQASLYVSRRVRDIEIDDFGVDDGRIDESEKDEAADGSRLAVRELALDGDGDVVANFADLTTKVSAGAGILLAEVLTLACDSKTP